MSISIPRISDSDPANAATFNAPLSAVESALNALDRTISSITDKDSVLISDVPVHESALVGDFVYFSENDRAFRPALSTLLNEVGPTGYLKESPNARVVGMVVHKNSVNIGSILVAGKYTSKDCVNNCIGSNPELGIYYLSDSIAGKVSRTAGSGLIQPVLVYIGDDTFQVGPMYQSHIPGNQSALRGIVSEYPTMLLETKDGIVTVKESPKTIREISSSPSAIVGIEGTAIIKSPMVSSISGVGLDVRTDDKGNCVIYSDTTGGEYIPASEYNLNGSKRVSDNIYTYIVFPRADSSVTISKDVRISGSNMDNDLSVKVWVDFVGSGTLSVSIISIPSLNTGDTTDLPTEASMHNLPDIVSNAGVGTISRLATAEGLPVSSNIGTLIAKVTCKQPAKILKAGFMLDNV